MGGGKYAYIHYFLHIYKKNTHYNLFSKQKRGNFQIYLDYIYLPYLQTVLIRRFLLVGKKKHELYVKKTLLTRIKRLSKKGKKT